MGLIKLNEKTIINDDCIIDIQRVSRTGAYTSEKIEDNGVRITFVKDGVEVIGNYSVKFAEVCKKLKELEGEK